MDKELQDFSKQFISFEEKLTAFFRVALPYIVLLVSVATTITSAFFGMEVVNPFTAKFFIDLAQKVLATMATYSMFCIHGNREHKLTSNAWQSNLTTWGEYSTKIRKNYASAFSKYCCEYALKCAERKRRTRFERKTLYPWEEYAEKYAKMSVKALRGCYDKGEITKADLRAFLQARKPVRPPRINATAILCGRGAVEVEKIAGRNRNYVVESIAARPFIMLLISAGFSIVTPTFLGTSVPTVIYSIVTSIFLIMLAAVTGNISGNNGGKRESNDVKSKIYFLDTFLETQKPPQTEAASSIFTTT